MCNFLYTRDGWMGAIETVSDQLQHSPEEKTSTEEENKKTSHKVVIFT